MKRSGSHLYSKVPPPINGDLSALATRVNTYQALSSPLVGVATDTLYNAFSRHLTSYVEKGQADAIPRQKLAKLTPQQFQELCTDVYDELMRRQTNSETTKVEIPFLSPQAGFHPKRNQARQKLATLPSLRFQDLTSDVRHELGRRYPACKEEPFDTSLTSPGSTYDNLPFPGIPNVPPGHDRDAYFGSTSENYPSGRTVVKTTTTVL